VKRTIGFIYLVCKVLAAGVPPLSPPNPPKTVNLERILIPQGTSQTVEVTGLHRAALANPKVARVRAVQNNQLLLTAKGVGTTVLRTWSLNGLERAFQVEVVSASLSRAPQNVVRIALEFLEIDESRKQDLGVRWPESVAISPAAQVQASGLNALLSSSLGISSARGWVQQIVREGKGKLLANPQLYVRSGEVAEFSSGGEIPVPTTSEAQGRVHQHVEWKTFGMHVHVKPETLDSFHWQADIQVELSELDQTRSISGVPALNKRKLSTKVSSVDGETVVLSGLVRQVQSKQIEGVPLLKDIPLLGVLFSSTSHSSEAHEILIALTLTLATRKGTIDAWENFENRFHTENP
jgi:Flp pilus assembly secretin CpaC